MIILLLSIKQHWRIVKKKYNCFISAPETNCFKKIIFANKLYFIENIAQKAQWKFRYYRENPNSNRQL